MALKLFCYRKGNSILHRIPPLLKIFFMMFFCITAFLGGQKETTEEILQKSVYFQLLYCICICILLFMLSKASIRSVLQMRWVLWFGLMVTIFRLFPEDYSLIDSFELYKPILVNGLLAGGLYTIRFLFASFVCQMVFETTSSLEIREGFENIHIAVCRFLPFMKKYNLAFVISLAVTFIPEVFETWEKVTKASKARRGKKRGIISFFRNLFSEMAALLSILIGTADTKRRAILNRGFKI